MLCFQILNPETSGQDDSNGDFVKKQAFYRKFPKKLPNPEGMAMP